MVLFAFVNKTNFNLNQPSHIHFQTRSKNGVLFHAIQSHTDPNHHYSIGSPLKKSFIFHIHCARANTRGGRGVDPPPYRICALVTTPPPPSSNPSYLPSFVSVTNQTKIPYPKPLKHSNRTELRLNESKNNSYFLPLPKKDTSGRG